MDPLVGHVELSLPPDSRYMRLARLMASGVASTCGLPVEDVEDFRIAVDELCSTLIEMGDGDAIRLAFDVRADVLVVEGSTAAGRAPTADDERLALSRQILDVVVDSHEMAHLDGRVEFSARKRVRGSGVG
jgi:serine/threonine-protein kinase RsbW